MEQDPVLNGGENEGKTASSDYTETIPLGREDIVSAEVLEGCPSGINPFDYGIDRDEFSYLKVTLSDDFCEHNPQISSWKRPEFLHDYAWESKYVFYQTEAVPFGDGKTFYLVGFSEIDEEDDGEGRRYLETLAYDYTHEPLTQLFYIYSISGASWETPAPKSGTNQVAADAFTKPSIVYTYTLEEEICSDEDWGAAVQTVKDRLETLGIQYAIGQVDRNKRTLLVRVEYSKGISDLMGYLVMENPKLELSMCGKSIRLKGGEAGAAVVKDGDRYVLSLDLSAYRKDLLNHLTSLSEASETDRLVLSFESSAASLSAFPFLWTDCSELLRDGPITLDHSAFSRETGFSDEERPLLDFAAVLLNGSLLPEKDGKQTVTLLEEDYAELDAAGRFCLLDGRDMKLDYSGYYEKLKDKAAQFGAVSSGEGVSSQTAGPSCYIIQFDRPPVKTQTKEITEALARLLPAFEDDIYEIGVRFDWTEGDSSIRVNCNSVYDAPGKVGIYIAGYGDVTQKALDELEASMNDDQRICDKIRIINKLLFRN